MRNKKSFSPLAALLIFIFLYILASTLESSNIDEDRQAQADCRVKDTVNNPIKDCSYE